MVYKTFVYNVKQREKSELLVLEKAHKGDDRVFL